MADAIENTEETGENLKIITQMRKRWEACLEADEEQRRDAMEDMKFTVVPGYQWDQNQKKERGERPCYEFNKVRVTAKRIINNMRINRPMGKVRGTEDSDKETAEVYEGLIRNIWAQSKGDSIIDYAAEYQVIAGYGAWRLEADYNSDDVFEQDISIAGIANPFCLFADPSDKDIMKKNARYWILTEKIPTEEYELKYKGKEVVDFPSHEFDDDEDWEDEDETRIAEYWWKEPTTKEIWQLMDGKVVEATDEIPEEMVVKRRTVETNKIMMCIASGSAILEGPTEWAGSMFPFVPVYGEYYIVDGRVYWNGITRFAKDPQRSYNVSRTNLTETIAQTPQSKYWATSQQAEGHTDKWREAHQKNYPFLLYNPDPQNPGPPQKMGAADVPVALIQESQLAAEEINMVTGVYQNDIGAPNAATSGIQERERNQTGQIATFNYQDNQASSIERTWELMVDLIPKIYDTERSLRVLGADDAESYVRINTSGVDKKTGKPIQAHDMKMGKYDVAITVGPSFTTKRQEAAETYQAMIQGNPDMFPIVGDLIFKAMDLPYAEDIAERLQAMLPPQIQQMLNEDQNIPPEVQQMMQQAKQAMAQVQEQGQMVEQRASEVQEESNQTDVAKSEVEKLIANLKTEQARFEAKVAKDLANIAKLQAELDVDSIQRQSNQEVDAANQEALNLVDNFNGKLSEDLKAIMQVMSGVVNEIDVIKSTPEKPRLKEIQSERRNGKLVATPVYEDTIQ